LEAGKCKPVFVDGDLYYSTDLTFTEVHIKCRELGLKKMINISDETIQIWYIEFLREKWSSQKFNQRISEMRNIKTYGERIDIADWFEKEAMYTPMQVANIVERKINSLIREAEKILCDKIIEVELQPLKINLESVRYKIAKTITTYYNNECEAKATELFEIMLPAILEKLGLKKEADNSKIGIGSRLKSKLYF